MEDWAVLTGFIRRLLAFPVVKMICGIIVCLLQIFFGETFRMIYKVIAILYLTDLVTGVFYDWYSPKDRIESRRLFHGLVKLCIYLTLLSIGHQCTHLILLSFFQGIIDSLISLTEIISILENVQKIAAVTGTKIPIIGTLIKLLQGKISFIEGGSENPGIEKRHYFKSESETEGDKNNESNSETTNSERHS